MKHILIIGGVAGGATAAAKIRRISKDTAITILEAGPDVSFANCGLPYYIAGDIKSRSKLILQSPESFKDQYDVTVHTETKATAIDREARTVTAFHQPSATEVTYKYDELILAQGGKPIIPPLPGADRPHVFSLWTLSDMDAIDSYVKDWAPKAAVVIGGGFIGLEMVEALRKRGLEVQVVERMPYVMPTHSPEISGFIQYELESHGVGVRTSTAVTSITKNKVLLDDGGAIPADMVLMSVGVKPTLELARKSGLEIGESGGLLVNSHLKTSDDHIYGVGDMVEITHKVSGKKVRIPLAGPANRQGRLVADNVMGNPREYKGSQGTSIVRVFDAVAASTGLSLSQAREAGLRADGVTIHKEHHTSYYPGAVNVTVHLVYDTETGTLLGGQTAGYSGADKRLDVVATAVSGGMTIDDLSELDLAYSPPFGTANDPVNMAAFVAGNRQSGFGPSITSEEIDAHLENMPAGVSPVFVDIRDVFAFDAGHVADALHIPLTALSDHLSTLPNDVPLYIYDETGKKGHQAVRLLTNHGFANVTNIAGGYISLERHARAAGFKNIDVSLLEVTQADSLPPENASNPPKTENKTVDEYDDSPIVIDVRTPEECATGMYPDAVNIPLDELEDRIGQLGPKNREITLYCASGARSAYGTRILSQLGFESITNGGGIMEMMSGGGRD